MLRADGHYTVGSGEAWRWQLAGGAGEFTRETFETLARRGAFESAPAGTTDTSSLLGSKRSGKNISISDPIRLPLR